MVLLEIDEILVPSDLLDRTKSGDISAKNEIRKLVDGLHIYMHNIVMDSDDYSVVTLRELQFLGIIESVKINIPDDSGIGAINAAD